MAKDDIQKLPYRPCVGIMLVNRHGLVFAGQRLDSPGSAWQMPQGGIDTGEDPQQAALRELGEETGIKPDAVTFLAESAGWVTYDLPAGLVPKLWQGRYKGQEQKWFLFRLDGPDSLVNIQTESPEFSRWQWMRPDELLKKIVPFKLDVYTRVFSDFAAFY